MSKKNSVFNRICEVARCERLVAHYKAMDWTGARVKRVQKHIVRVLAVDLEPFAAERAAKTFSTL